MVLELNSTSKVAIIGAGPAGCCCAFFLQQKFDVTIFDLSKPLRTLLPTGGGRCNLAYLEYEFKELAKNYPRGEKFLYSVFSKFSTADTVDFFENIGVKTYTQEDNRIFPISNSSSDVRLKILKSLDRVRFVEKLVTEIDLKNFRYVVVATGGHNSYSLIRKLGHKIVDPKPALVGLRTDERFPAGVVVKNASSSGFVDDILFTHEGVSGPLVYKISSINARSSFPYVINVDFTGQIDLQKMLNANPHKTIKNLLSDLVPKSFALFILKDLDCDKKCSDINGKTRDIILNRLNNYKIEIVGASKSGEVVSCGGVSLDEVNPKTMESKITPRLYFCGEVLDIDGFCGGFNLQNCWSTAYVAAQSILSC